MIEIRNLTKKYGANTAVENLNLTLQTGHIYGFLGPNGAGKSTTMNMIAGCLAATEGNVIINGHDIFEEPVAAKKYIGYLPELPPLYPEMTPEEYLTFVGRAKGIARSEVYYQVQYVMEQTGLYHVKDRLIENLSKGYRQRVGIAQAMLGEPEAIILDEPTVGLDPKQKKDILELIREMAQEHTVLLSSHILGEISAVCDRLIIISHGRVVANDTPDQLRRDLGGEQVIDLILGGDIEDVRDFARALSDTKSADITESTDIPDAWAVRITAQGSADLRAAVYQTLKNTPLILYSFTAGQIGLEEIYMRLTADKADQAKDGDENETPAGTTTLGLSDLEDFDDREDADDADGSEEPTDTKQEDA